MANDFRKNLTRLTPEELDEACKRVAIEDIADHNLRCEYDREQCSHTIAVEASGDTACALAQELRHLAACVERGELSQGCSGSPSGWSIYTYREGGQE